MANKIRVPATTVQLIQILGVILREHLRIQLWDTECWTFEHVADWCVFPRDPDTTENWAPPDFEMSVYLGSGRCRASGYGSDPEKAKELQLRVRCEFSEWDPAGLSRWDFQMWIRIPDGSVVRHHYACDLGYGNDRDISAVPANESRMPQDPPRKLAFWRQTSEPAQAA